MRYFNSLLLAIFASSSLFAQNHDHIWFIGTENIPSSGSSTMLNFNSGIMQVDTVIRNMPIHRTALTMSDSIGNLIFYSNGIWVDNAQKQLMQNGDSLNPGQVANDNINYGYLLYNAIVSIQHPVNESKYYVFHISGSYALEPLGMAEYLYYTKIDMNANNGLGRVESKNNIMASDSIANGQLQMVKHANGQDWWLIQPMAWSNGYYIFLVKEDTIELSYKQYIGNSPTASGQEWMGQSVFSPDGSKYARYDFKNDLNILDFDRCTGLFSNPVHIPIQDTIDAAGGTFTGVAISPSSQYLYVSSYNVLYQVDLWASNIAASMDTVAVHDGYVNPAYPLPTIFRFLRLGPDNKIYIMSDVYSLHTIESPDSGGTSCNVQQRSVTSYNINNAYIPNFPHYRTPALSTPCDTLMSTIAIVPKSEDWEVELYPNPASSSIVLESNLLLENSSLLEIYNALGQLVLQQKINKKTTLLELNISNLQDGVYIVQIQKNKQSVSKIFVVSKK